jgi:hypothetical protein
MIYRLDFRSLNDSGFSPLLLSTLKILSCSNYNDTSQSDIKRTVGRSCYIHTDFVTKLKYSRLITITSTSEDIGTIYTTKINIKYIYNMYKHHMIPRIQSRDRGSERRLMK